MTQNRVPEKLWFLYESLDEIEALDRKLEAFEYFELQGEVNRDLRILILRLRTAAWNQKIAIKALINRAWAI